MIGKTVNHYKIVGELGKGGMGEVYLAEDARLNRRVALKTLPPEVASDPDRRARFEREAKMIAALNHPNIVTIYAVEDCDGLSFISMELVDGRTLADLIPHDGLPLPGFFDIAIPLADALGEAHRKGITHRDLKPGNVMITHEGRVKVLDFGLAKLTDVRNTGLDEDTQPATETVPATVEGRIVGTIAFMSPEQAQGKQVDARSDVFSLGIVLYEMATGRRPFQGDSAAATIASILRDTPQEICELKPALPPRLSRVVRRCLSKAPDRRYQTALDVRNELDELKGEIESDGPRIASASSPARPTRRKAGIVAGFIVAALVIAAALIPWAKLRTNGPSPSEAVTSDRPASIAVLPFVNMSDDPANEYFSDGLAEELLNVLAKLQGLHVAARTSCFHFKGYTGDIAEIGKQLNVATVLEGSVRRAGDRVRITAQLINATDGFHLWSDTYDRKLDDVFAIQEDIAKQVVGALKVTLLGEEATRLAKRPTENLKAHDAYLLGQQRLAQRRSDSLAEAVDLFQKAIDLDPDYALAYVGLADANLLLADHSDALSVGEALELADGLIEKALKLDSQLGEAHATLGDIRLGKHNPKGAERAFKRAIELNPSYAPAYIGYGKCVEDSDRRMELFGKALELDPLSPAANTSLARALARAGRPEEALDRYRRMIDLDPAYAEGYEKIADLYANDLDKPDDAIAWYQKAAEVDPGNSSPRYSLAQVYQSQGRLDDTIATYRTIDDRLARDLALAEAYQHFGRYEDAIKAIRQAIASNPRAFWPYAQMAWFHEEALGRLDDAVRWAQKGLKRGSEYENSGLLYTLCFWYLLLDDETSARKSWDRFVEAWTENLYNEWFEHELLIHRSKLAESEALIRKIAEDGRSDMVRDELWFYDMRSGRHEDALGRYKKTFPRFFNADDPKINSDNLAGAINIAGASLKTDDRARAELLLRKCEGFIDSRVEGVRRANYRIEPVHIYALQGRKDEALAAFRWAIDQHWRGDCLKLELDPTLESLINDPRFVAMIAEVRADLAQQRQRLAAEGLATP